MDKKHFRPLLLCVLLTIFGAVGCDGAIPTPVTVTEVITFDDGETVIITRVFTPEPTRELPTPIATIFVPEPQVQLDVGVVQTIGPFDPQLRFNDTTDDLIENLYIGLTQLDPNTQTVRPEFAIAWEPKNDGQRWTFTLREDVNWVQASKPSGSFFSREDETDEVPLAVVDVVRRVTAQDVVAAVRRTCDPRTAAADVFVLFIIEGCEAVNGLLQVTDADLAQIGVRAISGNQIEFKLTRPAAWFPAVTTLPAFYPIPSERIADDTLDWLDPEDFVSSGTFVLSPFGNPELELAPLSILQANPLWPVSNNACNRLQDDQQLDKQIEMVNIYQFQSSLDALAIWEDAGLDVMPLPDAAAPRYINSLSAPPLVTNEEVFYLGFNFDSPRFNTPEIRRAFSAAIDREQLIEEVYGMAGRPMGHFTPPGVVHAPPIDQVGIGYSPDYALQQLFLSGYGACPLMGDINYMISASDLALQHAETLIDMWVDELGCLANQFKIEQVQFGTLLANTRATSEAARPDIFDLGWASFYPDAHNWFEPVLHCEMGDNRPNRACSEVDTILSNAAVTLDGDERTQLYRQAENLFFGDGGSYPIAPLYVRGNYRLTQDWITQSPTAYTGGTQFDNWCINQDLKDLERSQ